MELATGVGGAARAEGAEVAVEVATRNDDVAGAVVGSEDAVMCILADDAAHEMYFSRRCCPRIPSSWAIALV